MKRLQLPPALLLLLCATLLSACAVPLGPGYTVQKQQVAARWTGTPELAVRGAYRIENTGQGPLDYIEVTLPPESRRSGLQVSLNGSPVATQPADELAPAGTVRIPISPALPQKKRRELVIEYRLAGSAGDVSAKPSFYLETRGWYPVLREREGLFGSGGAPPEKWDLRVTAPRDFLVHASGQPRGRRRRGDTVEHRFRQRRGHDFEPYVVAGRYHEYRATFQGVAVIMWMAETLAESTVRSIQERVGRCIRQYSTTFGSPWDSAAVRIVHIATGLKLEHPNARGTFPDGVLLFSAPESAFAGDVNDLWRELDERLVLLWFFHGVTATPDAQLLFYEGLPPYGASIVTEAHRVTSERAMLASARLRLYEDAGGQEQEPRLFLNEADASPKRVAYARAKAPLFFLALEDRYGKEAVRNALARIVASLRGRQFNTNDLRVAIHLETGEDPAEFFRQWLNQPGIPEEFRQRYAQHAGNRK
jgi:hypothetical protein